MQTVVHTLTIRTEQNQQFIDVTKPVHDALARLPFADGMLVLNALHTTVALFVNEFQPALIDDLGAVLQKLIPRRDGYRHDDRRYSDCDRGNAHAHLRAMLLGRSVALPMAGHEAVLGQFQSIILAELDGPRDRSISVHAIG